MPADARASPLVSGRVASKGLSDELKGRFYAIVEAPSGRVYHVAFDARAPEEVRPGDIVSLATKPEPLVRAVDRQIDEGARAPALPPPRTASGRSTPSSCTPNRSACSPGAASSKKTAP